MAFSVAIVGRPNVGKSTLFNRLVGRRLALVDDLPGVTRDRREGSARLGDLAFTAIDTAGLEETAPRKRSRPHAGADRGGDRRGRCGDVHDRCAHRPDAGRSRLCRPRAPLRQAGDPGRQQERRPRRRRRASAKPMRSASAIRSRSRPSMARGFPISTTRCAPRCRARPRTGRAQADAASATTSRRPTGAAGDRSASPSSAGRMPASRR